MSKTHHPINIYSKYFNRGHKKILLMIKYCVLHEIMFYVSTAFVVLLPDCQFLITCINCGCFIHVHKLGLIWCEIYILAHHNAELTGSMVPVLFYSLSVRL